MRFPPDFDEVFELIRWEDAYDDLYPGYSQEPDDDHEYYWESRADGEDYVGLVIDILDGLGNPIPVWRALSARSPEDIDLEMPGGSWSFERDAAIQFGRHAGADYLLSGKVRRSDVDWEETLERFFEFSSMASADDELEIVVEDDGEPVYDMRIESL